jgi:hypothetical protein
MITLSSLDVCSVRSLFPEHSYLLMTIVTTLPVSTATVRDMQRPDTGQGLSEIFEAQQRIPEAKHNKTGKD